MPRPRSRGCQWSVRVCPMVATATRHPLTVCCRCWSRRHCERPSGQRWPCTSAGDSSLACDRRADLAQLSFPRDRSAIVSGTGTTALWAVRTDGLPPAIPFRMSSGSPAILDRTDRLERRWSAVCDAYCGSHFAIGRWIMIEVECISRRRIVSRLNIHSDNSDCILYICFVSCASPPHATTQECAWLRSFSDGLSDYLEDINIIDHDDESTDGGSIYF